MAGGWWDTGPRDTVLALKCRLLKEPDASTIGKRAGGSAGGGRVGRLVVLGKISELLWLPHRKESQHLFVPIVTRAWSTC